MATKYYDLKIPTLNNPNIINFEPEPETENDDSSVLIEKLQGELESLKAFANNAIEFFVEKILIDNKITNQEPLSISYNTNYIKVTFDDKELTIDIKRSTIKLHKTVVQTLFTKIPPMPIDDNVPIPSDEDVPPVKEPIEVEELPNDDTFDVEKAYNEYGKYFLRDIVDTAKREEHHEVYITGSGDVRTPLNWISDSQGNICNDRQLENADQFDELVECVLSDYPMADVFEDENYIIIRC